MAITDKKTEKRLTLVDYLTDFDVESVGIVSKGGNRSPFRILRSDKEEVAMLDVIQSVLIPRGATLEDLKEQMKGLHIMEVARVEEFPNYTKYEQRDASLFEKGSLKMEQLEGGALALVGTLLEEDSKAVTMRSATLDTPVGTDKWGYQITFGDLVYREVDNLMSAMFGAFSMSEMATKQKKQVFNNSVDAFKSYVNMGLDNLDDATVARFDPSKIDFLNKGVDTVEDKENKVVEERVEETPPVDVEKLISERLEAALAERDSKLEESITRVMRSVFDKNVTLTDEEKKAAEARAAEDAAEAEKKALADKIASLEARLAKFEEEDAEVVSRNDTTVVEDKTPPVKVEENRSVFKGIFDRKRRAVA
jgi:hypothetical protein